MIKLKSILNENKPADSDKFFKIVYGELDKIKKTIEDMNPKLDPDGKTSELQITKDGDVGYERYNLQIKSFGVANLKAQNWANLATVHPWMLIEGTFNNILTFWRDWQYEFSYNTFAKKLRNKARFDLAQDTKQLVNIADAVEATAKASKLAFDGIDRFKAATQTPR